MNQIKAAIFDVDGTLFDYKNSILPDSVVMAIRKLKEKGITVIVATSRSYPELSEDLLDRICADYYVVASGHSIQDHSGRSLYSFRFTYEQVEAVKNSVMKYGGGLTLRYDNCNCLYSRPEEMYRIYTNIGRPRCATLFCETMDYHKDHLPIGFAIKGEQEARDKICEELAAYPKDFRFELFRDGLVADIFSPLANKMTALAMLVQWLNIGRENCIAFGDGKNDLEMLKWAGIGVAMGNSCAEVKEVADVVCGATWEDGIANQLSSLQLI